VKRLITREDVNGLLNVPATADIEPSIAAAEAMASAYIEAASLHDRAVVERHVILYDMDQDETIEVRDGPIASVESMSVSGSAVALDSVGESEDLVVRPWTLKYLPGLDARSVVVVEFRAGYTPENIPQKVREALIATAALVFQHPNVDAISERIGDYMVQYNNAFEAQQLYGLTSRICSLLKEFKRPRI